MPLLGKLRIEFYIPCLPKKVYKELLLQLQEELSTAFGGCTLLEKVEGCYLNDKGKLIYDVINILFVDTPLTLSNDTEAIEKYLNHCMLSINSELNEDVLFMTVNTVIHLS